ncbi:MAG TPA: alpha/beta fold hydrolase [Acidimicrobiales bacterium]
MTAVATAADEVPVWLPAGGEELFAVLTRPTGPANGVAVVLSSSGHWVTTVGTNRTYVRLARALAAEGFHVVRFDYVGVGESSGPARQYRLDDPFVGDTDAVLDWLRAQGLRRFVFLGNCYGARVAIGAAQGAPAGEVAGVALFPPAVRDFGHGERAASLPLRELAARSLRRGGLRGVLAKARTPGTRRRWAAALRKKAAALAGRRGGGNGGDGQGGGVQWVSPHFLRPLEDLVDRRVPVLLVFGEDEDFHLDFERGRAGRLGKVLDRAGDLVTIHIVDGNTHGLGTVEIQDDVVDALCSWIPVHAR